jgi:hypothetical protein
MKTTQESEPAKSIEEQVREILAAFSDLGNFEYTPNLVTVTCKQRGLTYGIGGDYIHFSGLIDREGGSICDPIEVYTSRPEEFHFPGWRKSVAEIAALLKSNTEPTELTALRQRVSELESQLQDCVSQEDHEHLLNQKDDELNSLRKSIARTEARMNMYIGWYENAQQGNDKLKAQLAESVQS